jgi:4-hydroxybenzoate polyprenyltransferase
VTHIKAFFDFIRWKNLLIIALTQFFVRLFLVGCDSYLTCLLDFRFNILVLSTLLIAAAGYVINDYFDVKIDLINKPNEVYIGRFIKRRYALLLHQTLSVIGVILAGILGYKTFLIAVFAVTLLWFYASIFKKKPFYGNLIVAGLTGLSLSETAILFPDQSLVIHIYSLFAFFINLIREIIKDIEDIKGDKMYGATTLPIVWGIRKTKKLLFTLIGAFCVLVCVLSYPLHNKTLWFIFSLLGVVLTYITILLVSADRKSHFSRISKWCKWLMVMGVASMMVL